MPFKVQYWNFRKKGVAKLFPDLRTFTVYAATYNCSFVMLYVVVALTWLPGDWSWREVTTVGWGDVCCDGSPRALGKDPRVPRWVTGVTAVVGAEEGEQEMGEGAGGGVIFGVEVEVETVVVAVVVGRVGEGEEVAIVGMLAPGLTVGLVVRLQPDVCGQGHTLNHCSPLSFLTFSQLIQILWVFFLTQDILMFTWQQLPGSINCIGLYQYHT